MRNLNYQLKQLCSRNCDGSRATQRDRERSLDQIANQLHDMGYRYMAASSLKPKHVEALVERWKGEGLDPGTMKNRMADLRWWSEKINKQNVLARDNVRYGIADRQYVTNINKARELTTRDLERVDDPYSRMSLRLQAAFGLRRAESIKIRPEWADRSDRLVLKDSWTKGGRPREIPIRSEEQRQLLDEAKRLAGRGSLIPADKRYVEQLRRFEYQCAQAGINRVHGHRHQYAQTRYREITGWGAPAAGGPRWSELTPSQREIDREARLAISRELGHDRTVVTGVYLGR
jgi:site-specific recombinase XerC